MGHGNPVHPEGALASLGGSIADLGVRNERGFCELSFPMADGYQKAVARLQGTVAGVFLEAAMDYAVAAEMGGLDRFTTATLHMRFMAPVTGDEVRAHGRVTARRPSLVFAEGELIDTDGRVCVAATSTCVISEQPKEAAGHDGHPR